MSDNKHTQQLASGLYILSTEFEGCIVSRGYHQDHQSFHDIILSSYFCSQGLEDFNHDPRLNFVVGISIQELVDRFKLNGAAAFKKALRISDRAELVSAMIAMSPNLKAVNKKLIGDRRKKAIDTYLSNMKKLPAARRTQDTILQIQDTVKAIQSCHHTDLETYEKMVELTVQFPQKKLSLSFLKQAAEMSESDRGKFMVIALSELLGEGLATQILGDIQEPPSAE